MSKVNRINRRPRRDFLVALLDGNALSPADEADLAILREWGF